MIDVIAFDADDTLWQNVILYTEAQRKFRELLINVEDSDTIDRQLHKMEARNLPFFGYGVKSFTLSMIETAIELTGGRIGGEDVQAILNLGKDMIQAPIELLPGVPETLAVLAKRFPLMLLTKGDPVDQETKLQMSALEKYFTHIEIVREKTPQTYSALLTKHAIDPAGFLMVGNSLKSDVLPVVKIGGQAVHIPHPITWTHEQVLPSDIEEETYWTLDHIEQLPAFVENLNKKNGVTHLSRTHR
jgi:putative hydrolase of the HAD superfamily